VEGQNYLGIYLSKDRATVVCLDPQGRDRNILGCFSVSVQEREERNIGADMSELARLIAEGCARKELEFSEVTVALDCELFMQHDLHSEFKDAKQIAQTVRFDTEEALSTDISDVAVAFKITSSDQTGSRLTVFTAQRKVLSDVLLSLQSNNIDPITVEPDINALSRFSLQNLSLPGDSHSLLGILSQRSSYFITFVKSQQIPTMRTFLIDPRQNRTDLLVREVPLTAALAGTDEPIDCLKVFDSTDSVNYQQLSEKLGIEAGRADLAESVVTSPQIIADCANSVDFAIAYGAALAHLEKAQSVNFRNDFMPYQGKKVRLQKTLKVLSVSVSVLMLALGMYITSQLLQWNKYRSRLHEKFKPDYLAVMPGQKKPPSNLKESVRKLGSVLRRIENEKKGLITDEEAISAKLTLVLSAINECATQTDLHIDSVSVTAKAIRITGNTAAHGNRNTLKFFDAIKKSRLQILQQRLYSEGRRDVFSITVAPKV